MQRTRPEGNGETAFMKQVLSILGKLKGRSWNELRVRGHQQFAVWAERHRWSALSRLPTESEFSQLLDPAKIGDGGDAARSPETLLEHFRARSTPRFFPAFQQKAETIAVLRERFDGSALAALLRRAQKLTAGEFDLLGYSKLSFGEPIDWQLEPVAGKKAPLVHWSRISYLDPGIAGDKKITWELNRHQYFATLGRAYWRTGDEQYAQVFISHLSAWMDRNPPKLGINWASSLEVSFRAISWLWALHFFCHSTHLTPQFLWRVLKFIYLHARHLETYLSTYFTLTRT
ncbi:MAG: heparinase II/III family protein [Pyrinomonadaceae bacterium]